MVGTGDRGDTGACIRGIGSVHGFEKALRALARFEGGLMGTRDWLRIGGFACSYTWIFCVYLCFSPQELGSGYLLAVADFYELSFAVAAVVLLAAALSASRLSFSFGTLCALCGSAATSAFLGTVLLVLVVCGFIPQTVGVVSAAVAAGVGQSGLFLMWGCALTNEPIHAARDVSLSFLTAALLLCAKSLLSPLAAMVVISVFPLVSAVVCTRLLRNVGQGAKRGDARFAGEGRPCLDLSIGEPALSRAGLRDTRGLLARICMGALCLGVVMGVFRSFTDSGANFGNVYTVSKLLASLLCCLVVCLQRRRPRLEFSHMYRYLTILMGFGIALYPILADKTASLVVSRIGVTCFEALMWVMVVGYVRCFRANPAAITGLCWASLTGALGLGALLGRFVGPLRQIVGESVDVPIVLLFCLLVITTVVLTERDLIALEGWGVFVETPAVRRPDDGELAASQDASRMLPAEQMRCAASERADELAVEYGLSDREKDVLVLLALGKARSQIKDELYISMGTVNTHISHIYQKVGVHGKSELLELFE